MEGDDGKENADQTMRRILEWLPTKRLDIYIIKKVLGAYFLSILLIVSIAVVFDVSEKMDQLSQATWHEIIFDYYLNFIPYFANLFSPIFTFIAVIFVTSKMADDSEIIAMFAGGVSFHRVMIPYMTSAAVIAILTFILSSFVIPPATAVRLEFLSQYKNSYRRQTAVSNVQLEVEPGVILYVGTYERTIKRGYKLSLERFDGKVLVSRTTAQFADYDTLGHWEFRNYIMRDFDNMEETLTRGESLDTTIHVEPADFFVYNSMQEQMTNTELKDYIDRQKERGVGSIQEFEIEYEKRFAFPFVAFILTVIGFAVSSKKVKGGMGINLGIGLVLSFAYILFNTVSSSFAVSGAMSPRMAVWVPNIVFACIAAALYYRAPK